MDGQDFFFVDKATFRAEAEAAKFLEHACVTGIHDTFMYGTSIATVREVAATGRLCLMGIDRQGIQTLRANRKIDGLYVYIAPPDLAELERRARGRLHEAESTITKRLAWAEAEIATVAAKPTLYQHIVSNTEGVDFDAESADGVYYQLKEAISTLSPIIRNRLRGLPAYVLDYSDLIPPNLVEKPFLKPVVISGPTTGERAALMEQLVREFPDVFAFPQLTTTRRRNQDILHSISTEELAVMRAPPAGRSRASSPARSGTAGSLPSAATPGGGVSPAPPEAILEEPLVEESPYPESAVLSPDEFDAAVRSGDLVEHHAELFKHSMVTHRIGISKRAIKEVRVVCGGTIGERWRVHPRVLRNGEYTLGY